MEHSVPDALHELNQRLERCRAQPTPANIRALDEEWWDLLEAFLPECVTEFNGGSIELHAEERALVNHGLFAHPTLLPEYERALKGTESPGLDLPRHALERAVREALRAERVAELQQLLSRLNTDLDEWPNLHLQAVRYRDRKVLEALPDGGGHELQSLYAELDDRLEAWLATTTPPDELREYVETRLARIHAMLAPRQEQAAALATKLAALQSRREVMRAASRVSGRFLPPGQDASLNELEAEIAQLAGRHATELAVAELVAAAEAVQDSIRHLLDMQKQRRDTEEQLAEEQALAGQVSLSDLKRAMRVELRNMRGQMRIAARYAQAEPCVVPFDDIPVASQADCLQAMHRIRELDPGLFANPSVLRFGVPHLLLWPGVGTGVYDPARNRLIVPRRCPGGITAALAHACILYRIEVDATWHGRSLLESYRGALTAAERRQSNLKLRAKLQRDYVTFMTDEAEGRESLPRALRQWFEGQIAPPRDQPRLPPEYRALEPRQLRQRLEGLAHQPLSADREHRAACLAWALAPDDAEVTRNAALPHVLKAVDMEPRNPAYLYSAAVLYMRVGDFQRALKYFGMFTDVQGPGWWSNKARELSARCR